MIEIVVVPTAIASNAMVIWVALTLLRGTLTGSYPSPFLDVDDRSLGPVLLTAVLDIAVLIAIATVLSAVDARLPRDRVPAIPPN